MVNCMKASCETISDFLEWVESVHHVENTYIYQDHVYFRGHASTSWEILPSLFRDIGRIHDEHLMLEMASNMLWTELNDCKSELEKMIRLQHYGLHTRLLDVTFNPLVALFFACQRSSQPKDNGDGVVYCGYKEDGNIRACKAISEYVFNYYTLNINKSHLDNLCKQHNIKQIDLETIHFITPPLNNHRISIQNGAFIMSPLLKRNAEVPFYNASNAYVKKEMETAFERKCIIPQTSKTTLLKQLDYLGFNRATIYADISNKSQYINEKEKKDSYPIVDLS